MYICKHINDIIKSISALALISVLLVTASCRSNEAAGTVETVVGTDLMTNAYDENKPLSVAFLNEESGLSLIAANKGLAVNESVGYTLKVEKDISSIISKLLRNEHDVAVLPVYEYLDSRELYKGVSIFFICGYSNGLHSLISYKNTIKTFQDLEGASVAAVKGSSEYQLALFLIQLNNITPDSIDWHFVKNSNQARDMAEKGGVDAACVRVVNDDSATVLASSADASRLIPYVAVAHEKVLLAYKEKLQFLLEAVLKGNRDIVLKDTTRSALESAGVSADLSEFILSSYIPASLDDNLVQFSLKEEEQGEPRISYYTHLEAFLPQPFYSRPTKTFIGLSNTLILEEAEAALSKIRFSVASQQGFGDSRYLFSVRMPYKAGEESRLSSSQLQKAVVVRQLASLFPDSKIMVSYVPGVREEMRYIIENRIDKAYRVFIKEYIENRNRIQIDYTAMSKVYSNVYDGKRDDASALSLDFYSR